MDLSGAIDVNTDFQEDAGRKDPDLYSPLLQEFHRRLWNKPLPSGRVFELTADKIGRVHVLRHRTSAAEFVLSSDTLANSSRGARRSFYDEMGPAANEKWHRDGGSIGGRLLFPRNRIDGKQTINQQRGTHPRIRDRFDLTLEAIRRHYEADVSPLSETLERYEEFFALFESFDGYVEFFLLQDLVDDGGAVKFYGPFDGYVGPVLPDTMDEYRTFRQGQLDFVAARNARILEQVAKS
ncbi:hypothetical protein QL996_05020 [Planococcus sp. APC 4015]|nr:hypothetical protein [Planococcus sp. APC 4015]